MTSSLGFKVAKGKGLVQIKILILCFVLSCIDPVINGIGVGVFAAGIPLYFFKEWAINQRCTNSFMGNY